MYSKEELSAIIEEYIHALPFPEEPDTLYEPLSIRSVRAANGSGRCWP